MKYIIKQSQTFDPHNTGHGYTSSFLQLKKLEELLCDISLHACYRLLTRLILFMQLKWCNDMAKKQSVFCFL